MTNGFAVVKINLLHSGLGENVNTLQLSGNGINVNFAKANMLTKMVIDHIDSFWFVVTFFGKHAILSVPELSSKVLQ